MPALRRRVNRAVAKKAAASKKYWNEFYTDNPNWKRLKETTGSLDEAYDNQWASQAPSNKTINRSIAADKAYKRAMKSRALMTGGVRKMLNPEAAKRLKRIQDARMKRAMAVRKMLQ